MRPRSPRAVKGKASSAATPASVREPADGAYVSRRQGFAAARLGGELVARSRRGPRLVKLNPTAALIWQLCSGLDRVDELRQGLATAYPAQADRIAADLRRGIVELRERGLVRVTPYPNPARALLCIAFSNFWPGFDPRDNYFVWMMSHRFDVIVVDPRRELPDVLFYAGLAADGFDHSQVDRSRTCKVFFGDRQHRPDSGECDFAFTTQAGDEAGSARHQELPLWSLYVDWDDFRHAAPALSEARVLAASHPANVCNRLCEALDLLGDDQEPQATGPGSHSPAGPAPAVRAPETTAPPIVPAAGRRKLTIGMATFDDYDGVYFTVMAIRLFHPEVTADTEILVIDNNPDGVCAEALRALGRSVEGYRYLANREATGTASRDLVFREAGSPYAMCVDSHVLLAPGSLRRLIDHLDAHPDCGDLLQGPLVYDDLRTCATHFDPVWAAGMYGVWGSDPRGADPEAEPFEISMQGLGVFACRTEAWLGFNPRFLGFGGEEGYIHEKFRQAGRRTICLPFLRWSHRFNRPFGTRYPNVWEQRVRNYYIGAEELGLDTAPIAAHFVEVLGPELFEQVEASIRAELANPFSDFDAIYCINLDAATERWRLMEQRFRRLGILHRVRRWSAVETPESHHIGCALSHRAILERARRQRFQNVLVFEDDAVFLDDCLVHLANSIHDLRRRPWNILHLGGYRHGAKGEPLADSRHLEACPGLTCTEAVAYHSGVYERLLRELPADVDGMRAWLEREQGIDQYLRYVDLRYAAVPALTSQPPLLDLQPAAVAARFS